MYRKNKLTAFICTAFLLISLCAGCGHPVTIAAILSLFGSKHKKHEAVPLTITTTTLPYAINTVAYSQTIQAVGGTPPYTWSITASNPPAPITINSSTGVLSGIPNDTTGTYTFTVQVQDSATTPATDTQDLTIMLYDPLHITLAGPLPDAINGQAYSYTMTATGGTGNITWSISGTLPNPLTFNTSSGVISGTPSDTVAAYPITISVTDDAVPPQTDSVNLTINLYDVLAVTPATLPYAINGQAYSQSLAATGGTGTYTWSLSGGTLPSGMSITAGGAVSGTPNDTPGTYTFTAQATDNGNPAQSDTENFSLELYDPLQITTTSPLPNAVETIAYSQTLAATGGYGTYTWSNPTNDLPAWLSLDPATGELSGTPPVASSGIYNFTIRVTDSASPAQTDEVQFSLTVVSELTWEDLFNDTTLISSSTNIEVTQNVDNGGYARLTANLGTQAMDANYNPANDTPSHYFGDTTYVAQTFTVITSGRLTRAELRHDRNSTPGTTLTFEIRDIDSATGQPGTTVLTTVTFLAQNNWGWHGADFATPIDVIAGQKLALVCSGTGGTSGQRATSDNGNPYAGGTGYVSTDSGATWSTLSDPASERDLGFRIYVRPFNTFNTPGTLDSVTITPTTLTQWVRVSWNAITLPNTSITVQVLYEVTPGNWGLIPDADLPGNSAGFTTSPIDLSALPTSYTSIRLRGTLATTDNTRTPALLDWEVAYKP